ncbi:MAG: rhodanese-like domain-containing protein [Chloroflexi bacterium]|nr:rhodanese-like domain-containing protein [Chloroflexota bacterium]
MFNGPAKYLVLILRLALGLVFIWSGAPKLLQLSEFSSIVQSYHVLPQVLAVPFAYALPWIELILGILLFLGILTRPAAGLALALLLCFMAAIGIAMAGGTMPPDCGCFGLAEVFGSSGPETLVRDIPLVIIAFLVLAGDRGLLSVLPSGGRRPRGELLSVAGTGALLGTLVVVALAGSFYYAVGLAAPNPAIASGQVKIAAVAEVKQRLDRGEDFVLVDVRPEDEYKAGHIPGAVSLPLELIAQRYQELPKSKLIIVYCESADCDSSATAADNLLSLGFSNLEDMKDGIQGWQAAGYPLQNN